MPPPMKAMSDSTTVQRAAHSRLREDHPEAEIDHGVAQLFGNTSRADAAQDAARARIASSR